MSVRPHVWSKTIKPSRIKQLFNLLIWDWPSGSRGSLCSSNLIVHGTDGRCTDIIIKSNDYPCQPWPIVGRFYIIQSTLHTVSTLYSEHLHIVNNFSETLQWRFIGIVSLYSEPLHIVNKILLQIVFTIRRVDCNRIFMHQKVLCWV